MDIGTAKPSREQRALVSHHLIDIAEPQDTVSLAAFQRLAREAISGILARGRLPMLVGGTGQYIRAVTRGWQPPGAPPDDRLRVALERMLGQRGGVWLHGVLGRMDPAAARIIDHRNARRTIRALEVILTTGRRFSDQRSRALPPYHLVTIGLRLARPVLYSRIDDRIESMFASGLLAETQRLLSHGLSPDLPALSAIGYRECIKVLTGKLEIEEAKAAVRRATRLFVRRQANWFKETDPTIKWFDAADENVVRAMESLISREIADWEPAVQGAI